MDCAIGLKLTTYLMSQELVGNYQTVYSYLQIFGILADFGLYAVAVRELSRAPDRGLTFGTLFVLRGVTTLLSLGSGIALVWFIPVFRGTPLPLGVTIAAFTPFFTLLAGMYRVLFQTEYRMHTVAFTEITGKVIPVLLLVPLLLTGTKESTDPWIYAFTLAFGSLGALVLFLLSIWFARGLLTVKPRFSSREFLRIARLSTPFGLAFLMTTVYRQSDVSLIALLRPDYALQNAYYGVVLRMTEMGFLLPTFLLNSMLPFLTQKASDTHVPSFLGKILLALLTLGSTLSLTSYFWARPLVLLLTQATYVGALGQPGSDTAMQLMSFPLFLGMLVSFSYYLLLLVHRWRPMLAATTCAAILSLSLNVVLIPRFGFIGAAMTSIFVHLVLAVILLFLTIRRVPVYLEFSQFVRWIGFTISLSGLLYFTTPLLQSDMRTLVAGVFLLLLLPALLLLFGILPPCRSVSLIR